MEQDWIKGMFYLQMALVKGLLDQGAIEGDSLVSTLEGLLADIEAKGDAESPEGRLLKAAIKMIREMGMGNMPEPDTRELLH
jgi:hypothetical protein